MKVVYAHDNERAYAHIRNAGRSSRQVVRRVFFAHAKDLKASVRNEVLHGQKTGRVYKNVKLPSGRRKKLHHASAPGETHAKLSGNLLRTLGWKVHGTESMEFGYGTDGAQAQRGLAPLYAKFVLGGTRFMDPRDDLKNAVRATQGAIRGHFKRAIADVMGAK